MPLLDVAERTVIPVISLPNLDREEAPCNDSFALLEVGICFLGTLRDARPAVTAPPPPGPPGLDAPGT
ncbi:hypothetical protein [Streptomyces albipurpureus]|uniref:Uncharacterized protein n=1 Tax=Streptomyces albipurpureus TaxID=2897419 RepID=A0ABT0UYB6_9ACTN|nr:hypothetical protein [Streptomyces sp. CWNU-1]MCM2393567.1 hypothetical protein [Streptomyces sp. CWNU-1]